MEKSAWCMVAAQDDNVQKLLKDIVKVWATIQRVGDGDQEWSEPLPSQLILLLVIAKSGCRAHRSQFQFLSRTEQSLDNRHG